MRKEEMKAIHERLAEAIDVMKTLPDPRRVMRFKSSMPDPIRTSEDYWLAYGSEAKKEEFAKNAFRASYSGEQIDRAIDTMFAVDYAIKQRPRPIRRAVSFLLFLHGIDEGHKHGFRTVKYALQERLNYRCSHETVRRWFLRALRDMECFLEKNK